MGNCTSTATVESKEKPVKIKAKETEAIKQEVHVNGVCKEHGGYSLEKDGLNGRPFHSEELRFIKKVRNHPEDISDTDMPLSFLDQVERKFDVDSFLRLCHLVKVRLPSIS